MQLDINGTLCEVSGTNSVSDQHLKFAVGSRIFNDWKNGLDPHFHVTGILIQAVDFRGAASAEKVLFVRMKLNTGKPFQEIVELRGGTSIMLPVIHCEGQDYTVLTVQSRIAIGKKAFVEIPAGMIDNGSFAGAAAREIEEELGLRFREEDLTDLVENLPGDGDTVFFTPGLLDESARFYLAERSMTREELNELEGKATGLLEEGESITLKVVLLSELVRYTRDMKSLAALFLYNLYMEGETSNT